MPIDDPPAQDVAGRDGRPPGSDVPTWQDPARPVPARVADLLARMTLEEKVAQLYGVWVGADASGGGVAPHQHDLADPDLDLRELIAAGLGQLTRPFGTAPIAPAIGARSLAATQHEIMAAGRLRIPAVAHEECLAGFMTWGATVYPTALAWGASFDPALVERMATEIGAAMRSVGVHQGLAPVLDVTRDPRWGRTEETIGEDPYLVGTIGTAYVRGLQSTGIIATLKHFVGYSASKAGRNFGPVAAGPRELADDLLVPFEMAVRDGGVRSVMHSYTEIDGVPSAADASLLTDLLRTTWGFDGTVVADYFGVSFLELLHGVARSPAEAAGLALAAGVDVELPTVRCYREPLLDAVRSGEIREEIVDLAAARVLRQKCELGLLDADWDPGPPANLDDIDLDPPEARATARTLAEESVVLLANSGTLPLPPEPRLALVGPLAADPMAMVGCYSFPSHVGSKHPDLSLGVEIPSVLDAIREELPRATVDHMAGCTVSDPDVSGIAAAVEVASRADVCVAVVGDRAGLFGRGTSGEGCDAEDLRLPGVQADLLEALLATATPVVVVVLAGRPYALGAFADRAAAVVQAFFPGAEGGAAVAGVLSGRVCPSGRLPVSVPRTQGGQPTTYLAPKLGHRTKVSNLDPTPLYPFGHGLSYTRFRWSDLRVGGASVAADGRLRIPTDGCVSVSLVVENTGDREGTDVVQLYLHDPVAQVTRPVVRLVGYARVPLEPGDARRVVFGVHADLSAFTGRDLRRVVEPGDLELRLSRSSAVPELVVPITLTGDERIVDHHRHLCAEVSFSEISLTAPVDAT
ncbi:glycoside hydrolase family 3 N-terminal domain-containing protein [Actinopolymorpha sp. B17G11]|uniref:beta-xylosidase/alpha-l-arabinosidase n=1 Tax=Actinopolymorpha sp. B17G11 TaxID=3160861 RepID=UPI0032E52CFC